MQARWNTFYIMYHRHYFMFYCHWLKNGTHYTRFSTPFLPTIYHVIGQKYCPLNVLWLIGSRRMLMYQFQFYKKSNWEKKKTLQKKKPTLKLSLLSTHTFIDINTILPLMGKMTVGQTFGLMHHSLCNSINFGGQRGCNPMQKLLIMAF